MEQVTLERPAPAPPTRLVHRIAPDEVWRELDRASFAVIGYVTPRGEPRSSGVVFKTVGRRLFVAVAPDGWKARHIHDGSAVSVTVPVRRGGLLSLVFPIPPAAISFHAIALMHEVGGAESASLPKQLEAILPPDTRGGAVLMELAPVGQFLTYGIGVSLAAMRHPERSSAVAPVE